MKWIVMRTKLLYDAIEEKWPIQLYYILYVVFIKLASFFFFCRRIVYGHNEILVPVQSYEMLLFLEILNPFYVFQAFSLLVWFMEGYLYYAFAVICMSAFGIVSSIRQTRAVSLRLLKYYSRWRTCESIIDRNQFGNKRNKIWIKLLN